MKLIIYFRPEALVHRIMYLYFKALHIIFVVTWFAGLWDSICSEPQEKFAANPLVWVIRFRVLTPQ